MQLIMVYRRCSSALLMASLGLFVVSGVLADTPAAQPAGNPGKAEINALPPVGAGPQMVKPYTRQQPIPSDEGPDKSGAYQKGTLNRPLSREIVPPGYRYGSPGYMPDGRGGRGYDFGYPGYRDRGGGGYPHTRSFGNQRTIR